MLRIRSISVQSVLFVALATAAVHTGTARAAVFTVGSGGSCDFSTIGLAVAAAAVNTGYDSIYVAYSSLTLASTVDIADQSLEIVGGFATCDAAAPTGETQITMNADPAFHVHSAASSHTVLFQGLRIIRSTGGRNLVVGDHSIVYLYSTLLSSGHAAGDGGNVSMSGTTAVLYLGDGANVYNGNATGSGGGIYCEGGGTVLLDVGSRVGDNTAGTAGGGVLLHDCTLHAFAGTAAAVVCPTGGTGIVCNHATAGAGGGIEAENGSSVLLRGSTSGPALLAHNSAVFGAGLYAEGSTVELYDTWVTDNSATTLGGGLMMRGGTSTLTMDIESTNCPFAGGCSLLARNFAPQSGAKGGAIYADTGATLTVDRTTFTGNDADTTGSNLYLDGAATTARMEGILSYANSGSLNKAYFNADHGSDLEVAFATLDEQMGCCKALFDTDNGSSVELYSSILMAKLPATGQGRIFDEALVDDESRFADCILYDENPGSLPIPAPPDAGTLEAVVSPDALFQDRVGGDYRLVRGSQAEDFCDAHYYSARQADIDLTGRGYEDTTLADSPFGPFDLGFDEWAPLFVCSFETGSGCEAIAAWSSHNP